MTTRLNEQYFVRGLRESDVDGPYPSWFEDPEVCRYNSHGKFVRSLSSFRDYVRSLDRGDHIVWAICHDTDGHIGNISLQSISWINRSGELAVMLGDRRHWGKGVGVLAGRHLLMHAFQRLNLHKVHCGTAATNVAMCRMAQALGMREEGRRREHLFLEGQWEDAMLFGILRSEFQ
jgi:ribosomal-protein-alanine N-acetyltransferase